MRLLREPRRPRRLPISARLMRSESVRLSRPFILVAQDSVLRHQTLVSQEEFLIQPTR